MNRRQFVTAVASLSITSVAGCESEQPMTEQDLEFTTLTGPESDFYRAVDREAGIVIYANDWAEAGFEIIPIEDTDL